MDRGWEEGMDGWIDGEMVHFLFIQNCAHINIINLIYFTPVNTIINYLYSFLLNITNCKILFAILQYLPKDQLYASLNGKHCKQLALLLNAPL